MHAGRPGSTDIGLGMADKTGISWTNATWNPMSGCTRISAGCRNCYVDWAPPFRIEGRHFVDKDGNRSHAIGSTTGVRLHPDRLDLPLRWARPRRIFVNSLSDLFHDEVPDEFIARVFAVMAMAPRHTFQILTKRHARMRSLLSSKDFWRLVRVSVVEDLNRVEEAVGLVRNPLPNVWIGVAVEDQDSADRRIPALLATPAAKRFLSMEPLLGEVDLGETGATPFWCLGHGCRAEECPNDLHVSRECRIDWVIVGGESGPGARPMHPGWVRTLRDQCADAGVAFWFKQFGEWVEVDEPQVGDMWILPGRPGPAGGTGTQPWAAGNVGAVAGRWSEYPDVVMRRVGKRAAGHLLDGLELQQFPHDLGAE